MKRTIFLYCDKCQNVFLTTNYIVKEKQLVCGRGCESRLVEISKNEAMLIFQEK